MEFLIYFMHVFNLNNIRMKKKRTKWKYSKYKLTCNFKRVQKYYKRMQRCLSRSRTCPLTPWLISLWMSQPRTMHVISWWSIYLTRQIKITHYFWITLHHCAIQGLKIRREKCIDLLIQFLILFSLSTEIEIDLSSRQWEPRREVLLGFHRINLGYLFAFRSERYLNNAPRL